MVVDPQAPIVVGTDGSASADAALTWAADEARRHGRPVHIVHAIEYVGPRVSYDYMPHEETQAAGARIVERALATVVTRHPELDITTEVKTQDATQLLITASQAAAMVVVGSRGHGGFHDLILGSTCMQTAMHAACPVAVIRPQAPVPPDRRVIGHPVVVGVDGSPRSERAVEIAFAEAHLRRDRVIALHAWQRPAASGFGDAPVVYDAETLEKLETTLLTEHLAAARDLYPEVEVVLQVMEAPTAAALIEASTGADLVVTGSRGHGGFTGLLLGSVSHALIHHARCPVLIAR